MADLARLAESVIRGHIDANASYPPDMKGQPGVRELTQEALDAGLEPQTILYDGLVAGMTVVGKRFRDNEVFVPDVLVSAKAMKAGTEILKPHLAASGAKSLGTVVIGTVEGDMHDIGKNLVAMMLEGAGFKVIDMGVNVSIAKFKQALSENGDAVFALSALLTTTMVNMKTAIDALREARSDIKIIVGGAPVTDGFAREIGANGYAPDASRAVDVVKDLVGAA
ncbi:corrinoid protein [Candidatus Sumerlaeota bacterium]|nr:corrinoid protein [Candidatus Sumerlaeota bacterium]